MYIFSELGLPENLKTWKHTQIAILLFLLRFFAYWTNTRVFAGFQVFGNSNFRIIGLSGFRALDLFGFLSFRSFGFSGSWGFGFSGFRAYGLSGFWAYGFSGFPVAWVLGPRVKDYSGLIFPGFGSSTIKVTKIEIGHA